MVKFGERLPSLMQRGWEQYYLNYDAAKRLIESGTLTKTMSSEFYASIEKDLKKIDAFVQRRCGELRKAFKAAGGSPTKLGDVHNDLSVLRRFVGTNIIAATKIVKKHDKNVSSGLQKRDLVAGTIRGLPGLSAVPEFQTELEAALDKVLGKADKITSSPASVAIELLRYVPGAEDDDEHETEAVRARRRSSPPPPHSHFAPRCATMWPRCAHCELCCAPAFAGPPVASRLATRRCKGRHVLNQEAGVARSRPGPVPRVPG